MKKSLSFDYEFDFDDDLQKIVAERAFKKLRKFRDSLKHFGCGKTRLIPWDKSDFWEPYFLHICQREIFVKLHSEGIRYRKKYRKRRYDKDIAEAKSGSSTALARIIAWDKRWLFFDWVKERILDAQERQGKKDLQFLRSIGEAFGKKPGSAIKVSDREDFKKKEAVLTLVGAALIYHKIGLPGDRRNPLFKQFHQILEYQEFYPQSLFEGGYEYFMKFLRRHELIK